MNVFYSLQQYKKKMERKTVLVASGKYNPKKEKGEANTSPQTTNKQ